MSKGNNPEFSHGATKYQEAYLNLLINTAACNFVSKPFILAVSDQLTAYRVLKKALDNTHLKEHQLLQKRNSKLRRTSYYRITAEGLRYLSAQQTINTSRDSWVEHLGQIPNHFRTMLQPLNSERMARYLAVSGTVYLLRTVGIAARPIFTSAGMTERGDEPWYSIEAEDQKESLEQLIQKAMRSSAIEVLVGNECAATECTEELQFWNTYEIKQMLSQASGSYSEYHGGRYTGILESPVRSVLLYIGNKAGMSWSGIATRPEFNAHHVFSVRFSPYRNLHGGENHGVMFVDNARTFTALYLDAMKKRKKEAFADLFNSFTIFPASRNGVECLLDYMAETTPEFEARIINANQELK